MEDEAGPGSILGVNESIAQWEKAGKGWFSDLQKVLQKRLPGGLLPVPTIRELRDGDTLSEYQKQISKGFRTLLKNELNRTERKTYLLHLREEPPIKDGKSYRYRTACVRSYLGEISNPQHRRAYTRVLAGDHILAVERLRWVDKHRVNVPYKERACRFCRTKIESPEHVLLKCVHPPLIHLHRQFLSHLEGQIPDFFRKASHRRFIESIGHDTILEVNSPADSEIRT
ncbi:hypothetical protein PM082_008922 [Marasmius tenuissimus]|nr:hypothetical protein PM082_008922 [Marasmius tenuissimus]